MAAEAAVRDWSVYDRPGLRDAVSAAGRHGREILVGVDGMHCAACVARVERALRAATSVRVNLAARGACRALRVVELERRAHALDHDAGPRRLLQKIDRAAL